jgi:pimeloyl-ACP methyl ester carboxylesterase
MWPEKHFVAANGTEIYFEEVGEGPTLVLMHGATISTSEVWVDSPWSWRPHVPRLAEHFRVIAVDTRGHGRTRNTAGPISYEMLADDLVAFVDALDLSRPLLCGFSDGGHVVSLVGMRAPDLPGAIVNLAGYDLFNPSATSMELVRVQHGGSPDATEPELDGLAERFGSERVRLLEEDHDAGQGEGAWRRMLEESFARRTQPGRETFEDFKRIAAPTLIGVGDRDAYCTVEEACLAFRNLPRGELCVLPNVDHAITRAGVDAVLSFLLRSP